jgi:GH24 family phage-related lysozyme (muramidase)
VSGPIVTSTTSANGGPVAVGQSSRIAIHLLSLSSQGKQFVQGFEDFRPFYYPDSEGYCTAGWGHLINGHQTCEAPGIQLNAPISTDQAIAWFETDRTRIENTVKTQIHVPLYQREYDALVSLAFNLGSFAHAPNLRNKINQGQYAAGADEMLDITSGGTAGLVLRRQREHDMFMNGIYNWIH